MAQILIVEDEILVAIEMEAILLDNGHEVVGIAPDLPTARQIADKVDIDLALVDLNLRDGLTGPQVGMFLGERAVSVVFLTANPRLLGDGISGTIGVLTKPMDEPTLCTTVDYALTRRTSADAAPPAALRIFG